MDVAPLEAQPINHKWVARSYLKMMEVSWMGNELHGFKKQTKRTVSNHFPSNTWDRVCCIILCLSAIEFLCEILVSKMRVLGSGAFQRCLG